MFAVCCVGSGLCDGLFTFSDESHRVWGHAVVRLVEALPYMPEGLGFDWNTSLPLILPVAVQPFIRLINKYQEFFLGYRRPVHIADKLITCLCRQS